MEPVALRKEEEEILLALSMQPLADGLDRLTFASRIIMKFLNTLQEIISLLIILAAQFPQGPSALRK